MSTLVYSCNMASSKSDISSVTKRNSDVEKIGKETEVDFYNNIQNPTIRNLSTTYSQHATNDSTSSSPYNDIPQWKKDLIQRRKTNTTKTTATASSDASTTKALLPTLSTAGSLSPTSDSKHSLQLKKTYINYEKPMIHAFNANIPYDTKIHASQQITSTINNNNNLKTPATILQDECESPCGGHYTEVNNKTSGSSYNHNEKMAARTFIKQEEQSALSEARSPGTLEYDSSDGYSTLPQENTSMRLRKNLTQLDATNTIISDSLTNSTSRLSAVAEADNIIKLNKDNLFGCVGEQRTHTIQEPDSISVGSNNNKSRSVSDDDPQLHQQLKTEHERDSLSCANVNKNAVIEIEVKTHLKNNNSNGITTCPTKDLSNKKTCGIVNAPCKSSIALLSEVAKNPNVNNSALVSSHNYKKHSKLRLNQNTPTSFPLTFGGASPTSESTALVTNNKKKMVAAQEMSEVTTNELDFDSTEELQYGPGIVSKLRCRYLSLALRQSMDKQRLSMDTLRRATSLNNLLDDNDVNDDDEDDEEHFNANNIKETISPTSMCIQKIKNKVILVKSNEKRVSPEVDIQSQSDERATNVAPTHSYQYRSRNIKRGNDSLKRARSVEALLSEKSSWNFSNSQTICSNNTELVSIEDKIINARGRLLLGVDNSPKRLSSIIDDTERPPPDLVKQTLKKFEATANRRCRVLNRNVGGEVAMKVANYKSIITQNKPTITFPKPPISPKNANLKKLPTEFVKNSSVLPMTPNTINLIRAENNSGPLNSTPTITDSATEIYRQKMDLTPIKSSVCMGNVERLSEYSPDIVPRHKFIDKTLPATIAVDSPISDLTKKIENLCIESPVIPYVAHQHPSNKEIPSKFSADSSDRDSDEEDSIDGEYVVNSEDNNSTKHVSKSALENIARAGTSQHFLFKTKQTALKCNYESSVGNSEPLHDIPSLPIVGSTTVKQIGIIKPLFTEPRVSSECPIKYPERNPKTQSASVLTRREIEKNRINNEKNEKENSNLMDELKCTELVKTKKNDVSSALRDKEDEIIPVPAWSSSIAIKKKRNPSGNVPENNTMVFNFKDRKEVPDYIDNDGLIFKRKRELPKPNESGFVLLGDLSLETSTDPEDEWPMCPPSPCDVEFENANIIIDGKSSMKNRPKDLNIRVQFNDTLTSTFEYPSESSLIDESCTDHMNVSPDMLNVSESVSGSHLQHTNSPAVHHHVMVEEIIQLPQSNKTLGNLSLGSAPLNNYTPLKAKIDNVFQLGVTRVPNPSDKSEEDTRSENAVPDVHHEELENSSLDYLKPATDDLTIAYSEGSLKTDLLY